MPAAIAAEAAALQGKFWEMHDILFENQGKLDAASLVKYAGKIGLDVGEFEAELENPSSTEKVDNDFESGSRSGVESTPAFFINGVTYEESWEEEDLLEHLRTLAK
jgi:protein-disulfide isomerase